MSHRPKGPLYGILLPQEDYKEKVKLVSKYYLNV